jgi:hypothetical protein
VSPDKPNPEKQNKLSSINDKSDILENDFVVNSTNQNSNLRINIDTDIKPNGVMYLKKKSTNHESNESQSMQLKTILEESKDGSIIVEDKFKSMNTLTFNKMKSKNEASALTDESFMSAIAEENIEQSPKKKTPKKRIKFEDLEENGTKLNIKKQKNSSRNNSLSDRIESKSLLE